MPNRRADYKIPPNVRKAISALGAEIKTRREGAKISKMKFVAVMRISTGTLNEMELGNPTIGIHYYLTAAHILGITSVNF